MFFWPLQPGQGFFHQRGKHQPAIPRASPTLPGSSWWTRRAVCWRRLFPGSSRHFIGPFCRSSWHIGDLGHPGDLADLGLVEKVGLHSQSSTEGLVLSKNSKALKPHQAGFRWCFWWSNMACWRIPIYYDNCPITTKAFPWICRHPIYIILHIHSNL